MKFTLVFLLALSLGCAIRNHGLVEPQIPELVPIQSTPSNQVTGLSQGSLYTQQNALSGLISDTKAYRINDVVIVQISESTTATSSATTSTERENETDLGISSFFGVETSEAVNINPNFSPSAMVGAKSESSHEGKGTTQRSGVFSGTIAARVVQVLPSGYLVVQGFKTVQVNGELGKVYLAGMINPLMIKKDATISSQKVADLQLIYSGQGTVGAQQRPGWFSRLLMAAWPF